MWTIFCFFQGYQLLTGYRHKGGSLDRVAALAMWLVGSVDHLAPAVALDGWKVGCPDHLGDVDHLAMCKVVFLDRLIPWPTVSYTGSSSVSAIPEKSEKVAF